MAAACSSPPSFQVPRFVTNIVLGHTFLKFNGSGALPGKMLLIRIIENNRIDAYFRSV